MDSLLDPNSVITWADFNFIVECVRESHLPHRGCTMFTGLGHTMDIVARTAGPWQRRYYARDTPPISKAVGVALA